ncbi:MAG: hypothetical protein LBT48_05860 [Prevotellaceae bacterium]|jgi:hypothetical protein|nr:hypothetical protein [Prevotellaceae bacterium]
MKKKILLITVAFCAMATAMYAQDIKREETTYLGVGFGFDYGGFGGKIEVLPVKYLGLFAGLGYNLSSIGWNVGASAKLLPNSKVTPTLSAFYGYNAVLVIKGASEYNATSYSVTFGGGVDIKMGGNGNKLSINLFIPIRSQKFMDKYDAALASSYVEMESELLPIAFSIGYNFNISKR